MDFESLQFTDENNSVIQSGNRSIPENPENRNYQELLDHFGDEATLLGNVAP